MPPGAPPMMGAQTGPKMMFVDLLPEKAPDKTAWSSRDVELLTKKWRRVRTEAWVSGGRGVQQRVAFSYLLRYYMGNRVSSLLIPSFSSFSTQQPLFPQSFRCSLLAASPRTCTTSTTRSS